MKCYSECYSNDKNLGVSVKLLNVFGISIEVVTGRQQTNLNIKLMMIDATKPFKVLDKNMSNV